MPKRKRRINQAEVVRLFGEKLREVRRTHGLTQLELSRLAHLTVSYIWRLESGGAEPGIGVVDRLARALGVTLTDLLPTTPAPDTQATLRDQARRLFDPLLMSADKETLLLLNQFLARLSEAPA